MTISKIALSKRTFSKVQAMGDDIIASDAELVIAGMEDYSLLFKSFPHPIISGGDGIERPLPLGLTKWNKSQVEIHQQGAINMFENTLGHASEAMQKLISNGGSFNARVYEGVKESHLRSYQIRDAFIKLEPAERDWESKTQTLLITGTIFYHYFGEVFNSDGLPYDAFGDNVAFL